MIEAVIKESNGFKLSMKKWKCLRPTDTNAIEFIQQSKNKDGDVDMTSTYQFFMTDDELQLLCRELVK